MEALGDVGDPQLRACVASATPPSPPVRSDASCVAALPRGDEALGQRVEVIEDHVGSLAPLKPEPVEIGLPLDGAEIVLPHAVLAPDELNRP